MSQVVTHAGDLITGLRVVRSRIDDCLMQRGNPAKAYDDAAKVLDSLGGEVDTLRKYAVGLGEMWDTMRSIMRLAGEVFAPGEPAAEDDDDGRLCGKRGGSTAAHGGAPSGLPDSGEDWATTDPDD